MERGRWRGAAGQTGSSGKEDMRQLLGRVGCRQGEEASIAAGWGSIK